MELRKLGKTGLQVTPIGLGLAALGRPGYITLDHGKDLGHETSVAAMEANAHAVLDAAWQAGIRYFDAARSYGKAEEFLASWLSNRQIPQSEVTVGSKWGYTYTAGWRVDAEVHEVKEHSLDVLRRQIGESLSFLNGYLRLYQVHSATLESGIFENTAVLNELVGIKQDGLVIGLTLSGSDQSETLARAIEITVDGQRVFDCVQATWNLLETSAGSTLQEAYDRGMGVIVKEVLANGRLTTKNDNPAFQDRRKLLEKAAAVSGTTLDGLAIAAALAQPWAHVVLSGATTTEQLESNVRTLDVRWSQEIAEMLSTIQEKPEEYWETRSKLLWQ